MQQVSVIVIYVPGKFEDKSSLRATKGLHLLPQIHVQVLSEDGWLSAVCMYLQTPMRYLWGSWPWCSELPETYVVTYERSAAKEKKIRILIEI